MPEEDVNNQDELDAKVKDILSSDLDEAEKVRQLHALGFSRRQLEKELGFPKATVYTALPVKPEAESPSGKAGQQTKGHELMRIGSKEMIPPEQALRDIRLQDGDYKLGFIDGMGTLIMAARYNQILAASQAETLSNQLKIMEEARKGSAEVAEEAAMRAAAGVGAQIMPEVEALKNQMIASSPNPIMSMFAQTMQPLLGQVMGNMMTMFQPRQPAQPGQPGVQPPTPPPSFQPGQEASE
ncbi:unnamed protein product, partial [marine sediment metagenome]